MLVHHFKMRPSVITYNLSGMGCSAGIISLGLAKELLQVGKSYIYGLGAIIYAALSS